MRSAFVSHSTSDDRYVAEMESFLRAAGFDEVFNDVSAIRPDEKFWPEIEKGITNADTLVVVITFASSASEWVKREVEYARSLSKRIIPVWIEDCPIPPVFADRDVIDWRPRSRELRRADISRIVKYAPAELIGRDDEKKLISDAWGKALRAESGRPNVLTFVALGGEGKTSLVAKWVVDEMSAKDWPGCDAAFAWSFYSQGTREQVAASSDLFLKEALTFFGDDTDKQFAASSAGAFEKGQRLARLVGRRRNLLILDGLEPLQYAPTAPTPGELKDQGIAALLKGLAAVSHGLCVVTTRYSIPDLKAFWQATAPEVKLLRLSRDAGVHLLKCLGVRGTAKEFATLVEDVKGHALTVTLLGGFLKRAFHGDIRQRDCVKFEKADEKMDGGHAFRTMAAYEQWLLRDGGDEGRREVAVLRLMGLFDRPADAGCLMALRTETIPGLTEPLVGLVEDDWEYCLSGLEAAILLTVNRDASGALVSLDAHPHLREYFARQLRTHQPDAWRTAHRRLYEYLCANTQEGDQPTLEDLQPLYQAVAHGCQAGLQQESYFDVLRARIFRGPPTKAYSWITLGALESDLATLGCFFERPYTSISASLGRSGEAEVLALAGFLFCLTGRLLEGIALLKAASQRETGHGRWFPATPSLCTYELFFGDISSALKDAQKAAQLAALATDKETWDSRESEAWDWMIRVQASLGDAFHQAGKFQDAQTHFREHERICRERSGRTGNPALMSIFQDCDFLLSIIERPAWRKFLQPTSLEEQANKEFEGYLDRTLWLAKEGLACARKVKNHALIGLHYLTLLRSKIYRTFIEHTPVSGINKTERFVLLLNQAERILRVERRGGQRSMLIQSLLTRAWLRFLIGARTGLESAQEDLNEAWEIAERGPMKLFLADIHLYRARLFGSRNSEVGSANEAGQYPWESPQADLAAAEKLINDCGYHRRDEELADAKAALLAT